MSFTAPYQQHNYMGENANTGSDAEANTFITSTLGWSLADGMWYYDTTNDQFRVRVNGAWTTMGVGTPALSSVLTTGNDTSGNDIDVTDNGDSINLAANTSIEVASGASINVADGGIISIADISDSTFTGTPVADTDPVNKAYVDSVAVGLSWKEPCAVLKMVSDADQGGSPPSASAGDAYVVNNWGVTYNNGDIVEYNGSTWNVVVANSGSEPPDGTRVVVTGGTPAGSFATEDNNIGTYDATGNTWSFASPSDGDALLINGENSIYENRGFTYDTSSTSWIEFTGLTPVTAGLGLAKTGNTLNVDYDNGAIRTSDGSETVANNPIYLDSTNGINVKVDNSTIGLDSGNDYRLYIPNGGVTETQLNASVAGTGLTGGGGSALTLDLYATEVTAAGDSSVNNNPIYLDSSNGLNVMIDNSTIDLDAGNSYRLYVPNGGITETQLNSSVAGAGISGGGGSALALDVHDAADGTAVTLATGDELAFADADDSYNTKRCTLGQVQDFISSAGLDYSLTDGAGITDFTYNGSANATVSIQLYATEVSAAGGASVNNNPIYLDATNGMNIMIDGSTIDLDAGNSYRLYVPSGGITATQLNTSVAGAGISGGGGSALALDVHDAADGTAIVLADTDEIAVADADDSFNTKRVDMTQIHDYIVAENADLVDGNGIADFTYDGSAGATVTVEAADTATKGGLVVDSDGVRSCQFGAGNPNGSATGVQGERYLDTTNNINYVCHTDGDSNWVVI